MTGNDAIQLLDQIAQQLRRVTDEADLVPPEGRDLEQATRLVQDAHDRMIVRVPPWE